MHDFVGPTCSIQILEQGRVIIEDSETKDYPTYQCDGNETLKQVNSTACLTSDLKRVYTPACKSKFIIYYSFMCRFYPPW